MFVRTNLVLSRLQVKFLIVKLIYTVSISYSNKFKDKW